MPYVQYFLTSLSSLLLSLMWSLMLKTNSGKSMIKYICSNTWNLVLKDLSKVNIEKYNRDPFWMNKTNINTFKHPLKKYFLEHYWPNLTRKITDCITLQILTLRNVAQLFCSFLFFSISLSNFFYKILFKPTYSSFIWIIIELMTFNLYFDITGWYPSNQTPCLPLISSCVKRLLHYSTILSCIANPQ